MGYRPPQNQRGLKQKKEVENMGRMLLSVRENCERTVIKEWNFKEIKKHILINFDNLTCWMYDTSEMFHLTDKEIKKKYENLKSLKKM